MGYKAILPAAGKATRLWGLPKYLLPVQGGFLIQVMLDRLKNVAPAAVVKLADENLLRKLLTDTHVISTPKSQSMSDTLLAAKYWAGNERVLVGMPDTYFDDGQAFGKVAAALRNGADVALGCWTISPEQRGKLGQVITDGASMVVAIEDKNPACTADVAWGIVGFAPRFWDCILSADAHLGIALQRAIDEKMIVQAVACDGKYWDCGTPAEYFKLVKTFAE